MAVTRMVVALVVAMFGAPAALAALSVYMPHEAIADRAVLIVEGTVLKIAAGYDPEARTVATYITLDVQEVHRGPSRLERLVIREPGGTVADLSNVLDAVPVYTPGEHVVAFLEPAADGALRTTGMFFGKYTLSDDRRSALRDLDGRGLIVGRPSSAPEMVPTSDLLALAAGSRQPPDLRFRRFRRTAAIPQPWSATPPEMTRVLMDPAPVSSEPEGFIDTTAQISVLDTVLARPETPAFTPLSPGTPARWYQVDNGAALTIDVEPDGNPMADDAAAVAEMERAMAAWTSVPESRIALQLGNGNADFTGSHFMSPADTYYSGTRIILFDDPYNDISDPINCSGVLAIGGYWRSGATGDPVNGVTYSPALSMYVIFNNDFQCFLGDPDNLAEVATHELGHAIGLGHSTVPDAIMRSSAYGWERGPRLGDDDMDAVHCIYPHTLSMTSPVGGETFTVGESRPVTWNTSLETGPDTGEVDLEYSADGGGTWLPLASGTSNDGYHDWSIDAPPGALYRVRAVRHNRIIPTPAPYPSACSAGSSPADFTVAAAALAAVPDGSQGPPLILGKSGTDLTFRWGDSGSDAVDDHAIYRGDLDTLRAGTWNHMPETCNAGNDLFEVLPQSGNSSFYLVSPLSGSIEGDLGSGSDGQLRPESVSPCGTRE